MCGVAGSPAVCTMSLKICSVIFRTCKMKTVFSVLVTATLLSGCYSELDPQVYKAKQALYKEVMLNGEVLGSDGKVHTVKYNGDIYTCYNSTGFCTVR